MADNKFKEHFLKNPVVYQNLYKNGFITGEDIGLAANKSGEVSFKEQDAALQRINDGIQKAIEKNPNLKDQLTEFYEGTPKVEKFTPNKKDWRDYNQEQMGRLAESMHFNWKNKDDRSVMMNQLMNETIRDDKKKLYEDYKKEHPIAGFINEHIIAPNVSQRLKKGEDITNTDIALDAANVGTYLIPGAGAAATKAGRRAWLAADAAAQGASELATDLNQGNELGMHNIIAPVAGAAAGTMTELVPRMVKLGVDAIMGGLGGRVTKPIGDVGEDAITKVFGNATKEAKDQAIKENKAILKATTKENNKFEKVVSAQDKELARKKITYLEHPEWWLENTAKGAKYKITPELKKMMENDPVFSNAMSKLLKETEETWLKKQARGAARGASRNAAKGYIITQTNQSRSKDVNTKERQEADDEQWYIDHYSRFWDAGFAPHGPDSDPTVKAYKKYIKTKDVFGK